MQTSVHWFWHGCYDVSVIFMTFSGVFLSFTSNGIILYSFSLYEKFIFSQRKQIEGTLSKSLWYMKNYLLFQPFHQSAHLLDVFFKWFSVCFSQFDSFYLIWFPTKQKSHFLKNVFLAKYTNFSISPQLNHWVTKNFPKIYKRYHWNLINLNNKEKMPFIFALYQNVFKVTESTKQNVALFACVTFNVQMVNAALMRWNALSAENHTLNADKHNHIRKLHWICCLPTLFEMWSALLLLGFAVIQFNVYVTVREKKWKTHTHN